MSYRKEFFLTHDGDAGESNKILNMAINARVDGSYYINYALDGGYIASQTANWRDHDSDMKSFSKLFPSVLFMLSCNGDDDDNNWRKYYRNGKMMKCKASITYDPFDESRME